MTESTTEPKGKQSNANKHYTQAVRRLKKAHPEEFESLLNDEYAKAGEKRVIRLTPEQRDAKIAAEAQAKAKQKVAEFVAIYGEAVLPGEEHTLVLDDVSESSDATA